MAVFIPSKIESYLKTSTKGCLFQHSYAVLNTMTEYDCPNNKDYYIRLGVIVAG